MCLPTGRLMGHAMCSYQDVTRVGKIRSPYMRMCDGYLHFYICLSAGKLIGPEMFNDQAFAKTGETTSTDM